MKKKHLIRGLSFLFLLFSAQATSTPWAVYLILQADGFLHEAAQEIVTTFENRLQGFSTQPVHVVIDLYRGNQLSRSCFIPTKGWIKTDTPVEHLETALKKGAALAFQGCSQCKTLIIYSGHGRSVEEQIAVHGTIPYSYMVDYGKKRALSFLERVHGLAHRDEKNPLIPLKAALPDASGVLITMPLFKALMGWVSSTCLEGKKIDIVGFDACQMALLEYAEELAVGARYMIASQEREYKNGWNYQALLDALLDQQGPHRVGRHLVYSYELQQRRCKGISYSLSLLDLGCIERLVTCFQEVAQLSRVCISDSQAFREVFAEVRFLVRQKSLEEAFIDLSSYGEELLEELSCRPQSAPVQQLSKALERFLFELRKAISASVSSSERATLRGCSVYFPFLFDERRYRNSFSFQGAWSAFLSTFNDQKL